MSARIDALVARGALFVVSHSGGKDSQAMLAVVRRRVPASQIIIIHAELPGVDWPGCLDHIRATAGGLPVHSCTATRTFFQMVEARGLWPSPSMRQCTSDLKRTPLDKLVRRICRETGQRLIVNCQGLRAEESPNRARKPALRLYERGSKAGREWHEWLPIHDMPLAEVWATIAGAGQRPHPAYAAGMTRLSCCFCIMASRADLHTAARLQPALARRYMAKERELDQTFLMPRQGRRVFLDELIAEAADLAAA